MAGFARSTSADHVHRQDQLQITDKETLGMRAYALRAIKLGALTRTRGANSATPEKQFSLPEVIPQVVV
jgi:hypothetical protein